jgi:adenine-specific DNA-methyltransferase
MKVADKSIDVIEEKIKLLKDIIPECFSEGKLPERLEQTLGKVVEKRDQKYTFDWARRNDAFKVMQTPSSGTLVPSSKKPVNFDETENVFIEGDNLEVLKLLQKSYFEKVKVIYIDPPYNTGKDFIYKDDFRNQYIQHFHKIIPFDMPSNTIVRSRSITDKVYCNLLNKR